MRAQVKNAIGIFCTWVKTEVRVQNHAFADPRRVPARHECTAREASATATRAMTTASQMIMVTCPGRRRRPPLPAKCLSTGEESSDDGEGDDEDQQRTGRAPRTS
jgi:hypothetical protein